MKMLIAVALVATSFPLMTTAAAAGENDGTARERRVCAQVAQARAGSHMTARRICRTAAQWREALGPDWRQYLGGARDVQETMDGVTMRSARQSNPAIAPN